jgi:recombination protein RecA
MAINLQSSVYSNSYCHSSKAGGICAFIDVNNNLDIDFVKKLGVDVENLIMSKPNSNEALEIADNLLRSGQLM